VADLLTEQPRRLVIANRTHARAVKLAARFERDGHVSGEPLAALSGQQFDIVVNATSLGLGTLVPPGLWPHRLFGPQALAYDLIYADRTTPFLDWAQAEGAGRTADGLGMLIEQAAESFYLWRGVRPDTGPVFRLLGAAGRG
jgi:shikimate dehydrogenase